MAIKIYLCVCEAREGVTPHWLLMLVEDDAERGTWIHLVGGPSNKDYTLPIQANKGVDSFGIAFKELLSTVDATHRNKILAAA